MLYREHHTITSIKIMSNDIRILCWCDSGDLYANCHLKLEVSELSFSEKEKIRKKIWNKKYCLHPNKDECKGKIIEAHTVQKSMLKKISSRSCVYTPSYKMTPHEPPSLFVKRVGIGDASIFTGFCGRHDKEVFFNIEDEEFTGSSEQCFLYAYRATCKELFLKKAQLEDARFNLSSIKRDTFEGQKATQKFLNRYIQAVEIGINELTTLKKQMDGILLSSNFEEIHNCVFWIDQYPEILCNTLFQPDFDFRGKLLQDSSNVFTELDGISLSFITTAEKGAVVLCWHRTADSTCLPLIESLFTFSELRMPDLLVNWAIKEAENVFFSPSWWESLPPVNQQIVIEEFRDNPVFFVDRSPKYITEGRIADFDWKIERVTSNVLAIL